MKKILILALGNFSNGEITIAIDIFRNIDTNIFTILFVSHRNGSEYIRQCGFNANELNSGSRNQNRIELEKTIFEFKPDLIVCADVFTLEYSFAWSGVTFEFLRKFGLPICSIDQYNWQNTNYILDYPGTAVYRFNKNLIESCNFLIRQYPINNLLDESDTVVKARLYDPGNEFPTEDGKNWRINNNIDESVIVIFYVNSNWEYVDITKTICVKKLIDRMPQIIINYFTGFKNNKFVIMHVGPVKWTTSQFENIEYRYFNYLKPSDYNNLLYHADLFLTTNAISITLSHRVMYNKPCILFQNFKTIEYQQSQSNIGNCPQWYKDMVSDINIIYPFRIFPWGWFDFLKSLMTENPYFDTICISPLFEYEKTKTNIEAMLFEKDVIDYYYLKQKEYMVQLNHLPLLTEQLCDALK